MIRARTEPILKMKVEKIFSALGLSCSEAINIFYKQVELHKGIPFDIKVPNKTTLKAIKDVDLKRGLTKANDADDIFNKLGI